MGKLLITIEFKGQKLTNLKQKEKGNLGPKKHAGTELKKKKKDFWAKIGKNIENKVQQLSNFKEKKDFLGQQKEAAAELKNKTRFFGTEVGEKLSRRAKN